MATPVAYLSGSAEITETETEPVLVLDDPGVFVIYLSFDDMVSGDTARVLMPGWAGRSVAHVVSFADVEFGALVYVTTIAVAETGQEVEVEYLDGTGATITVEAQAYLLT